MVLMKTVYKLSSFFTTLGSHGCFLRCISICHNQKYALFIREKFKFFLFLFFLAEWSSVFFVV